MVPCTIYTFRSQKQDRHGPVDGFLGEFDPVYKIIFLIDQGSHKLGCVDDAAPHLLKLCPLQFEDFFCKFVNVIDSTNGRYGIRSVM